MDDTLENKTDAELLAIIRRAENTNIPGSLFQRAQIEYNIRHNKRMENLKENQGHGVFFQVGGDMTVKGDAIQTDPTATVGIAVAGNYKSEGGRIIQGNNAPHGEPWYKEWWMLYIAYPIFALVVGTLILKYLHLI